MTALFADTFFYLALLNPKDRFYSQAHDLAGSHDGIVVTTAWILTELADALAQPSRRSVAHAFLRRLAEDPSTTIVPPNHRIFEQAVRLYGDRPDKDWPLTDCISFVVMQNHGITEALTGDRHFEQAGFRALFQSPPAPTSR